jgi:RimJ/RimL family protein N-acetyltransferase
LEQVKRIYRGVCQHAFCFIIEFEGKPVGECYLQEMNLKRILEALPGQDLRRIDIMIGEKELWEQGIGTKAVGMLVEFGFEEQDADAIFGCDVDESNVRSLRMFKKLGFVTNQAIEGSKGEGKGPAYDMILTRERFEQTRN